MARKLQSSFMALALITLANYEAPSSEVTIIGIDLVKRVFQVHGPRNDGSAVFREKLLSRCLLKNV